MFTCHLILCILSLALTRRGVSRCKRIKSGSRSFECAHGCARSLVHRATTVDELRNSAASDRQRCSTALWPAGVRSKHRYLGRAFPPRCAYSRVLCSVWGDGHSIHRFRLRFQVNRLEGRGRRVAKDSRKLIVKRVCQTLVFVANFCKWRLSYIRLSFVWQSVHS